MVFPLNIHRKFSNNKRFMPLTSPFVVYRVCENGGLCFIISKQHIVMFSIFIISVPLSATKTFGNPNSSIQSS